MAKNLFVRRRNHLDKASEVNRSKIFNKNIMSNIMMTLRKKGAVVQPGLRFAPGACEVVGSNPTGPTIAMDPL